MEKQAEMNWFASSEQPAIKRFYWSSQFSPTWLSTNEHTAPLLRGKNGVERFPSLRTQWSGFQLCEKGKRKLQPLVTSNKMLSSSFPFRNASEAEIYSGNHLIFQLLISMLIQKKSVLVLNNLNPTSPAKAQPQPLQHDTELHRAHSSPQRCFQQSAWHKTLDFLSSLRERKKPTFIICSPHHSCCNCLC